MRRLLYFSIFLIAVMVAFTIPLTTQEATPEATPEAPEGTPETTSVLVDADESAAYIRFGQFASDQDTFDIFIDGEASTITDLEFAQMSDWTQVIPGDHSISIAPAGAAESEAVVGPIDVNLVNDNWLTVLIILNAEDNTLGLSLIQEDPSVGPPGTANVAFANALASGEAVNFLRDDVVFTAGLTPSPDGTTMMNSIPIDAQTNTYSATFGGTDEPVAAEPVEFKATDMSMFLILLAGRVDAPELLVFDTSREQILLLTGELEEPGTLIEAAQMNENLASFFDLADQAGLTETLSGEGPYTVFAPAGFALDNFMTNSDQSAEELESLLRNHIVEGNLKLTDLMNRETVTTLAGNELTITEEEQLFVNGAQIIETNIPATNGTIHIINEVLAPDGENDQ